MKKISKEKILAIKKSFEKKTKDIKSEKSLNDLKVEFLGRKSELVGMLKELKTLSIEKKKEFGKLANQTRQEMNDLLEGKLKQVKQQANSLKKYNFLYLESTQYLLCNQKRIDTQ